MTDNNLESLDTFTPEHLEQMHKIVLGTLSSMPSPDAAIGSLLEDNNGKWVLQSHAAAMMVAYIKFVAELNTLTGYAIGRGAEEADLIAVQQKAMDYLQSLAASTPSKEGVH